MIATAEEAPFANLSPDLIADAVEAAGFPGDGRILALGSYENRVFQVGVEDSQPVVVKFYRPGRWTDAAIAEEHAFARELAAQEIPVVAPYELERGGELGDGPVPTFGGFRFAVYPRRGGQWPELGTPDDRQWIGRFLGRIHAVGAARRFEHCPRLSVQAMGRDSVDYLLAEGRVPEYIAHRYEQVSGEVLERVEAKFDEVGALRMFRIHGDCHRNNVLWTDAGPHFVDLDDCMTGPAIQDLWMLLAGRPAELRAQLADILEGYSKFADFDMAEARLIEPLRALRMLHYAAWLARRWHDPAFPRAFPWFGEARYWERHVAELEEQLGALLSEE
ncbi:MAG TPA: serine/threonine protein kinase [Steroidobacteraceae bacterium]|nr:serine/threonine protein kinase [Steroidobacteraceae bacterium]